MLRYNLRRFVDGWAVIDTNTGQPAVLNGVPQTGFSVGGAQDFANILNRKARGGVAAVWGVQSPRPSIAAAA